MEVGDADVDKATQACDGVRRCRSMDDLVEVVVRIVGWIYAHETVNVLGKVDLRGDADSDLVARATELVSRRIPRALPIRIVGP